jgi:hypothetical protein
MEVDEELTFFYEDAVDHMGQLMGKHPVGISREDPIQVKHIDRRVSGQTLKCQWISTRNRGDRPAERELFESVENPSDQLD